MSNAFHEYYRGDFRADFQRVFATAHRHHEFAEPSLQPHALERHPLLRSWDQPRRSNFALSLFLTVLADQVCFTHFRWSYERFRELTMYPKLKGECPGGCDHHAHPAQILKVLAPRRGVPAQDVHPLTARAQDPEVLEAMRDEVVSFVSEYLPWVDPADFWAACAQEIFRWPERGFRYGEMRLR